MAVRRWPKTSLQTFKDREDDASQLNRLGVAYFHLAYFRFLPRVLLRLFRRRTVVSVFLSPRPISGGREKLAFIPAQFLAEG